MKKLEILQAKEAKLFSEFRSDIANEKIFEDYKDVQAQIKAIKDKEALKTFKSKIDTHNEVRKVYNEIIEDVCNVIDVYPSSLTTQGGTIRKTLLDLLPKHEKVRYCGPRHHFNGKEDLRIFINLDNRTSEDFTIYHNRQEDKYQRSKHEILDFNAELKKAKKYDKEFKNLKAKYETLENPHSMFKEFISPYKTEIRY